tara:strand:+ start:2868 stop:3488 length:621 start_codon:yes stop_codon:yes gene_type:complete
MIHNLFPSSVLIEDVDLTDEQINDLSVAINTVFKAHEAITGCHKISGEDSMPLFTKENTNTFPILKKLRHIFIDGFLKLAESDPDNILTKKSIELMMDNHAGRLPIMKTNDYKGLHSHPGTVAYGIFYLTDVNNDKDGGKLILRDPSFHISPGYRRKMKHEIETKRGRLVIAPSYVWHEVTPYYGTEDRITVVSNLSLVPEDLIEN